MDRELFEEKLSELPLYLYAWIDPKELEFSGRIRWICENECPMYGKTWACPPGVGTVLQCQAKCMGYQNCQPGGGPYGGTGGKTLHPLHRGLRHL